MRNGTAPQVRMRQETITENAPSYNSPDGSGGTGNTSMGSPSMGHLMETWSDSLVSPGRTSLSALSNRVNTVYLISYFLYIISVEHHLSEHNFP